MNFNEISKLLMNGEKIFNLALRVVFYARVSTDSDVQLNSLDNQLSYYKNYIKEKAKWIYVDGYVDEGISGVRVEKRDGFKRMIEDAKKGKFDLIITKEVSRFARDLEDSIHYIRILKENNVGIYFENQNLNTFDSNSELILNIMFNLAQDESKKLSSRVKFGHREAIKKGHVLGSSNIIGYKKENCKLVIDEDEAKFIRKVFLLYASGKYGFYKLSKELKELGFYNKNGNMYDKDTLKRIIKNPKYKGYYRGRTTETIDYRTKKRIKIDEEKQIIYKANDIVPAIITEQLWDKANEILSKRIKNKSNNNSYSGSLKYPFSSKIYCKEHNVHFQRSHGNKRKNRPTWSCSLYLQQRLSACISPIIAEIDLYNIIKQIMNNILPNNKIITDGLLMLYNDIGKNNQYTKELKEIDKSIKNIEDKKNLLIDMVINKEIKKESLKYQFKNLENKLLLFNKRKEEIYKQIEILKQSDNESKIKDFIIEELNSNFLEDFVRNFVEQIVVSKIDNDRYNIKLDIYLNLSGITHRHTKGAKCINELLKENNLYLENQTINTLEKKRKKDIPNKFTYNVYVKISSNKI